MNTVYGNWQTVDPKDLPGNTLDLPRLLKGRVILWGGWDYAFRLPRWEGIR